MLFPAFWAPNYHTSTSGNYSVCMAIRCEINLKKNSSVAILGRGVCVLESIQLRFNSPSTCLFSIPANPFNNSREKKNILSPGQTIATSQLKISQHRWPSICIRLFAAGPASQAAETVMRSISCNLQLRLKSNESKNKMLIKCWNGHVFRYYSFFQLTRAWFSLKKMQLSKLERYNCGSTTRN